MAEIHYKEKFLIEKLIGMPSAYVMDFSNRTFEGFIYDGILVNIYNDKYFCVGSSKANRHRGFFSKEPNYKVGELLTAVIDYWHTNVIAKEYGFDSEKDENIYKECLLLASRLKQETIVDEIEVIKEIVDDRESKK